MVAEVTASGTEAVMAAVITDNRAVAGNEKGRSIEQPFIEIVANSKLVRFGLLHFLGHFGDCFE